MFKSNSIWKTYRSISRRRRMTAARLAEIEYQIRQINVKQNIINHRLETGKFSWES